MHRAGINRARLNDRSGGALTEILVGVVYEFRAAPGRAKVIQVSLMFGTVLGRVGIDVHAADGVFYDMNGAAEFITFVSVND